MCSVPALKCQKTTTVDSPLMFSELCAEITPRASDSLRLVRSSVIVDVSESRRVRREVCNMTKGNETHVRKRTEATSPGPFTSYVHMYVTGL